MTNKNNDQLTNELARMLQAEGVMLTMSVAKALARFIEKIDDHVQSERKLVLERVRDGIEKLPHGNPASRQGDYITRVNILDILDQLEAGEGGNDKQKQRPA